MIIDLSGCSLVLMVTMGCNAGCAHCCLACDRTKVGVRLSGDEMEHYIHKANKAGIQSVVFTGGEPMIFPDSLHGAMKLAKILGMYIDLRTNGFWATNESRADAIIHGLCSVGLRRLGLSFDRFHEQYLTLGQFQNAYRAGKKAGLVVYVDWMGRETEGQVVDYLGIDGADIRMVGAPLKVGSAKYLGDQYFDSVPLETVEKDSEFSHSCGNASGDSPLLTVFPGGYASLHPCCWVNPPLIMPIKGDNWLEALVEEAVTNPATLFLCDYGIGGLIGRARDEHPALLKPYYSHQCEACYDLLGVLFPSKYQLPDYLANGNKSDQPVELTLSGVRT